MTTFPYQLSDDARARLGLIVLQVDETIEGEFRACFPPEAAKLHVSRVPSGADLTPDTIAAMEHALPTAAALLPPAARFDVVAYACTSGTTQIGAERVHQLVAEHVTTRAVTDPLTAALAAIAGLGLSRIGIVSPYVATVAAPLCAAFERHGLTVPDSLSFGEEEEARVARIAPSSIVAAASALANRTALDGIFISCTNLRTRDIIEPLERKIGLPVLTSNQVLAWHMARLATQPLRAQGPGRLLHGDTA